jgi:Predicted metal binding domain
LSDPVLVDPALSQAKLDRELAQWAEHADRYRARGWLLVGRNDLTVDIALVAEVALTSSPAPLPIVTACIRLRYDNYDLWPPSLTFIDLLSGQPAPPHVSAPVQTDDGPRNVLVSNHPDAHLPFLCIPGIREYHSHPQHSGDDWLLHRAQGAGRIVTICDRVWRFMARNVLGLRVTVQGLPTTGRPDQPWQVEVLLAQGDIDQVRAQLQAQQPPAPTAPLP